MITLLLPFFFFLSRSDMSKAHNLTKNSPAVAAYQEPTPGPRQNPRKNHTNKKKKGGRF